MEIKKMYESPDFEMMEIESEGVFCTSPGNEGVGEEEGVGGFN